VPTKARAVLDDRTPLDAPAKVRKGKAKPKTPKPDPVHRWASAGVFLTLGLSAWLNGLAFSSYATTPLNGWVLGLLIPVLVLVFSRVSALLYAKGLRPLSYAGAGATLCMLLLSVQHCAVSISRLTGEHLACASLMALALDCGLVICECATVKKFGR
jgi:hypothetical protein